MGGKKMKRFTSIGTVLFVLILTSSLFASGVGLTGIGARATALGGNFRAISNDWSAMYWNPAGITQISGAHFGLSGELILLTGKYKFKQNDSQPFGIYKTSEITTEPKNFFIPAAGFVYGLGKMSFGISVYAPFGLGGDWHVLDPEAYYPFFPIQEHSEFDYDDDLSVIDIHPTFAYQLSDKLSVGVGFSFVLADIIIQTPKTTPNPLLANALLNPLLTQFGLAADIYNYILTNTKLEGDGTGFGFNFGLKFDVTKDLSLGLSGNWYNDVALDGKLSATTYYAKIDDATFAQLSATLDGLIQLNQLTPELKQQILGVYSGQKSVVLDKEKGDADLPLPMTIGAGLAYKGIEKLLVSADLSWTQWSSWDAIEIALNIGQTQKIALDWKDAIRFGLGLEYQVSDLFKIRAGYYTEPSAVPDETFDVSIPDPGRRHGINLGLSYDLGFATLFGSYETLLVGERNVKDWTLTEAKDGFENMAGNYKLNINNLMFGLAFDF
jgi:long-chain fatty acid transport protein